MLWKRYLKKTMAKNFLKLMTHIKSQIQEEQRRPMEQTYQLYTRVIECYSAIKCSKLRILATERENNKCIFINK